MTFAKRMTLRIIGLTLSLTVLGAVTMWGLLAARRSTEVAREEYHELRFVLDADEHLFAARETLLTGRDPVEARRALDAARERLAEFRRFQTTQRHDESMHEEDEDGLLSRIEGDLGEAADRLATGNVSAHFGTASIIDAFGRAQTHLKQLSTEMDERIAQAQFTSGFTIRMMLAVLGLACLIIVAVTAVLNIALYRSIILPLQHLASGVRRIADGRLDERLEEASQNEFAQVARDFNHMAARLEELYETLEERVRVKSCELVRSERLASVGYLAAGVAHEINNPLGIITGYAEVTLKRLQKQPRTDGAAMAEEALRIIRDEAFRCKGITEKLLSLAAGREVTRERVQVRQVLDDIMSILGALPQYRDRKLAVDVDGPERLEVLGNEAEIRQIVLNLAINALEAVQPTIGEVRFDGRRKNGVVELVVSDNGRGMTPETLEHVFEPFYTNRLGTSARGIGLGLSITNAIIEAHGGRIRAESNGPNTGSRFVIELPAAVREEP